MDFDTLTSRFEQWLLASGYQVSPKVRIADLRGQSQGRGVIALKDIAEGEVIASIPRNVLLNIETGTLSQREENKEKLLTKYDHWEGLILTILFELSLGQESRWAPYFNILPHEFHSLMFWTEEELDALSPSLVLNRIGRDKAEETYKRLIPSALQDLGIPQLQVSLEQFHMVASTILSYSFDVERPDFDEDEEDDEEVKNDGYYKSMIALADTLNANTKLNNAVMFYEPEFIVMKAIKPIHAGEQIYNTYGDHPNSELLRRYGYVEYDGSQFDFGEVTLPIIRATLAQHFHLTEDFVDTLLEIISEADIDGIEEELVLESYDAYADGEVLPEAPVLIQSLAILAQISEHEQLTTSPRDVVIKSVNRVLKKCFQLVEAGSMTKTAVLFWEQCVINRLSEYPSHAFREFLIPDPSEHLNSAKMSECILKSEVKALQQCQTSMADQFRLIDDEKLIRNILKRKASNDGKKDVKRQRVASK